MSNILEKMNSLIAGTLSAGMDTPDDFTPVSGLSVQQKPTRQTATPEMEGKFRDPSFRKREQTRSFREAEESMYPSAQKVQRGVKYIVGNKTYMKIPTESGDEIVEQDDVTGKFMLSTKPPDLSAVRGTPAILFEDRLNGRHVMFDATNRDDMKEYGALMSSARTRDRQYQDRMRDVSTTSYMSGPKGPQFDENGVKTREAMKLSGGSEWDAQTARLDVQRQEWRDERNAKANNVIYRRDAHKAGSEARVGGPSKVTDSDGEEYRVRYR